MDIVFSCCRCCRSGIYYAKLEHFKDISKENRKNCEKYRVLFRPEVPSRLPGGGVRSVAGKYGGQILVIIAEPPALQLPQKGCAPRPSAPSRLLSAPLAPGPGGCLARQWRLSPRLPAAPSLGPGSWRAAIVNPCAPAFLRKFTSLRLAIILIKKAGK